MKNRNILFAALTAAFVFLMSLPFLIPHMGWTALIGLIPLLCMERIAHITGMKRFWVWHYSAFALWNAVTTFWVCNATIGGGIFAILANSLQMSLVFGLFRWSRKVLKGVLPYIFLAALWIAWEKYYLVSAQISWPWLVLGNAFAGTTHLAQWYEYLGTLGGSLWIWACNLSVFGIMVSLSDASWQSFNAKAKTAYGLGTVLLIVGPAIFSLYLYKSYTETDEPLEVAIFQPNIDPYNKFERLSQEQQNAILLDQMSSAMASRRDSSETILAIAPETFTGDIITGDYRQSRTWRRFRDFLSDKPGVNLLFGASSYDRIISETAPSPTARHAGSDRWIESHNSALMMDSNGDTQIYHKSKLVVGVEMTPYPKIFCKIDDLLGGVMGRCVGQKQTVPLYCTATDSDTEANSPIPIGCAICYESVYPEHCARYIQAGASVLAVITNDAWWGDTPGYRQHLNYARLRAIENRRDIARCANTGISAIIDQRGDILAETHWWQKETLRSHVNLNNEKTFFSENGDFAGRLCTFIATMLLLCCITRLAIRRDSADGQS